RSLARQRNSCSSASTATASRDAWATSACSDDLPRSVDLESKDVGPVVVPGRIETLPRLVQLLRIELGVEDAFLVPQRAGEVTAVRREDGRAARADQLVALG